MSENVLRVTDIEHLHWSLSEADVPISIALDHKPLSLAAAVELAIIEAHYSELDQRRPTLGFVTNCSTRSIIKATNWPLSGKVSSKRERGVVAIVLPKPDESIWWSEQLRLLKNDLTANHFPPNLAAALTGGVAEMVDNAWFHGSTDKPALLAYQVRNRRFAFSVADIGVGILESLRQNPKFNWLRSSMEAIHFAIQPGVSRCENGGMGFTTMLTAMADLWGNARIRSGQAALIVDGTQEIRSKNFIYLPPLPGLHVSVRCSLDSPRS
jgi:anti-sigma regulatory factor (Ser/Thr protein kinase)